MHFVCVTYNVHKISAILFESVSDQLKKNSSSEKEQTKNNSSQTIGNHVDVYIYISYKNHHIIKHKHHYNYDQSVNR